MMQILRRISRIAKSYLIKDNYKDKYFNSDDEELKRIIDELNDKRQYQNFDKQQAKDFDFEKACKVLGVRNDASIDEIKSAFRKKIKQYHPDKINHLTEKEKAESLEKAKEIINAYEFFKRKYNF